MTDKILTKTQIVDIVSEELNEKKTNVAKVFDEIFNTLVTKVSEGNKISINKFGVFEPRKRSERNGVNPQTGESIKIKASVVPAFKASKAFKEKVSELSEEQLV